MHVIRHNDGGVKVISVPVAVKACLQNETS